MTNYTKNVDYAAKDLLAHLDPLKTIYGTELDAEFTEIAASIATKYQSSDIATQAQAEAGTNNTTLMTPLRVSQFLGGAGGGSGAGMVGDIVTLADPNADRILFWDDSAGSVAMLQASTGLSISGTVLTTNDPGINHNNLLNYDANKHVDHTLVLISGAGGITGGGSIFLSRTLTLDITSLTADASPDLAADYLISYDASAAANKKVLASNLVGNALGDGSWSRNAIQVFAAATEATVVFNSADYDSLARGTFSIATGIYTAGASGARIAIYAQGYGATHGPGASLTLNIYKNTTIMLQDYQRNDANSVAEPLVARGYITLTLTAGDTVKVTLTGSSAFNASATYTRASIVELG